MLSINLIYWKRNHFTGGFLSVQMRFPVLIHFSWICKFLPTKITFAWLLAQITRKSFLLMNHFMCRFKFDSIKNSVSQMWGRSFRWTPFKWIWRSSFVLKFLSHDWLSWILDLISWKCLCMICQEAWEHIK